MGAIDGAATDVADGKPDNSDESKVIVETTVTIKKIMMVNSINGFSLHASVLTGVACSVQIQGQLMVSVTSRRVLLPGDFQAHVVDKVPMLAWSTVAQERVKLLPGLTCALPLTESNIASAWSKALCKQEQLPMNCQSTTCQGEFCFSHPVRW